jgi:hypothetical protein
MRVLELNGRIEASGTSDSDVVVSLFRTIAGEIDSARREIDELAKVGALTFSREAREARRIRRHVERIRDDVDALARRAEPLPTSRSLAARS